MKTQTNSRRYEGQCKFCKMDFSKRHIIDHLTHCEKRTRDKNIQNLRVRILDPYMKNFWLIVECNQRATLKDLDTLMREVWVECCGHLSLFGGYGNEVGKRRSIMDVLQQGDTLSYIYDFGTSTELSIEALGDSNCEISGKKNVELVARNYVPQSLCAECGEQATSVCTVCAEEEPAFACDRCVEKYHNEEIEGEEHYILPVANSPRCGVCGYEPTGPVDKLF